MWVWVGKEEKREKIILTMFVYNCLSIVHVREAGGREREGEGGRSVCQYVCLLAVA